MDSLQTQVISLSKKIDALYQITEQLSIKVASALEETKTSSSNGFDAEGYVVVGSKRVFSDAPDIVSSASHKDVLTDMDLEAASHGNERELEPSIQIQRLTAQLTAAYNRIAALEEQLLSRRVH